jgi:peptidoglycan/xylan/chitin deacetylase (PgdA/CDA1 family)
VNETRTSWPPIAQARQWVSRAAILVPVLLLAGCVGQHAQLQPTPPQPAPLELAPPPTAPPQREVAITFDDLPFVPPELPLAEQRRRTDQLLRALAGAGAPVAGFVNEGKLYVEGELDPQRVELLERWAAAGAELGNHTFGHRSLHNVGPVEYEREILRGEEVMRPLLARRGRALRYFRHPFLRTGRDLETRDRIHAFLAAHDYRVAPVTMDNSDWIFARAYHDALARGPAGSAEAKRLGAEFLAYMVRKTDYWERQTAALFGRQIRHVLLLHANEINADHLPRLLAALEARGYRFVTLDRALEDPAYGTPESFTAEAGISWVHRWVLSQGLEPLGDEPRTPEWVLAAAGVDSE